MKLLFQDNIIKDGNRQTDSRSDVTWPTEPVCV